jgi:hypothetical protein
MIMMIIIITFILFIGFYSSEAAIAKTEILYTLIFSDVTKMLPSVIHTWAISKNS